MKDHESFDFIILNPFLIILLYSIQAVRYYLMIMAYFQVPGYSWETE